MNVPKKMDEDVELDERATEKDESSIGNVSPSSGRTSVRSRYMSNLFAMKKSVAQGMMDVALITANANQLRYVVEFTPMNSKFFVLFTFIVFSLILQVIVGVFLIFKGRSDFRRRSLRRRKSKNDMHINNCVMFGVFLITVVNVFIAAFSVDISSSNLQVVKEKNS